MAEKIFFFRDKNDIEDRDACKYVEYETPEQRFHCGHYFGKIGVHGPNFWGGELPKYKDIETFLAEEEYNRIISVNNALNELGNGITYGDDRYKSGIALHKSLEPIFDKLRSEEAAAFKDKIMESEHGIMKRSYDLSDEDVEDILDRCYDVYEDKGIVCYVYEDYEELGRHCAEEVYSVPEDLRSYIDYERYGQDIAEEERFVELSDGRIVELSM